MNPPVKPPRPSETDAVLDSLFEQITAKVQAGEPVDIEVYVRQFPEQAERLRRLVPAVEALADLGLSGVCGGRPEATSAPQQPITGTLGDFRILREVGRGGMGVVYEAEEISLGRRVALKVLPFAAMLSQKHLQRFQNEARAAASLDHHNIVGVHSVGCQRGVHYYAMHFIDGQTLAEVTKQLRQEAARWNPRSQEPDQHPGPLESEIGVSGGQDEKVVPSRDAGAPAEPLVGSDSKNDETRPVSLLSTDGSTHSPEFFRSVARLGIQAAEALEHAHAMGVVHRDIKPSNIMLAADASASFRKTMDGRGGTEHGSGEEGPHVWITDFGLAMTQSDTGLSMTGDIVGTLRYMSPEQVAGNRQVLDHRTDIYSLGLTLYELLALEAAFPTDDRQTLMRQIAEDDPRPPRRLNRSVPKDLERIILKAVAKDPLGRYASAQQFANDLRCFLEHKPIRARPASLGTRISKWSRRHQAVVWSVMAVALIAVVALASSTLLVTGAYEREKSQRQVADEQRQLADQRRRKAESERDAKARALVRARGFRLAAQSTAVLRDDPALGLLLALEGHKRAPGLLANNALLAAMDALHQKQTVAGHGASIRRVQFSPGGRRLLTLTTGGGEHAAAVWDVSSGKQLVQLNNKRAFHWLTFGPQGDRLLSIESSKEEKIRRVIMRVWDVDTGNERLQIETELEGEGVLRDLSMEVNEGQLAAFSPDGQCIVGPSRTSGTASVYDAATGKEKQILKGHDTAVLAAAFSPDGQKILTVSADQSVRLWDGSTGEEQVVLDWLVEKVQAGWRPNGAGPPKITRARFSTDGRFVLTRSTDVEEVRLWDARTGEELGSCSRYATAISPDCRWVAKIDRRYRTGPGDPQLTVSDFVGGDEIAELAGHEGAVTSVVFAPNGERIVTGAENGTLRVWETRSGREIAVLRGHTNQVDAAAFSLDGSLIASGSRDTTARIWTVASGAEMAKIPVEDSKSWRRGRRVAVDPTGRYLFVGNRYSVTGTWDVESGQQLYETRNAHFTGHASFTPDGRHLLTPDGQLLEVETGQTTKEFSASDAKPLWSKLGPHGRTALTGAGETSARLWDVKTGSPRAVLESHTGRVNAGSFSPDGETVVTVSSDKTARLWDTTEGRLLHVLRGHAGRVRSATFAPDGAHIVTTSTDTVARAWSVKTGQQTDVFKDPRGIEAVAISPDSERLLSYRSNNPVVRIWDLASGEQLVVLEGHELLVESAVFSPEGRRVLTCAGKRSVQVWEAETGRELLSIEPDFNTTHACFAPDGQQILTISGPAARLWDAATGKAKKTLFEYQGSSLCTPVFSPDGSQLAAVLVRCGAVIWDRAHHRSESRLKGHGSQIMSAAFSADGNQILTTSRDRTSRTWNAASGKEQAMWVADHHVESVPSRFQLKSNWGADGKQVVSLCRADPASSCVAWIWDAGTGQTLHCLEGHTAPVLSARLSPDGTGVITTSVDETARIWDAATGKEQRCLDGHEGPVTVGAFSPDNRWVLTASSTWTPMRGARNLNQQAHHGDRTVRVWNLDGGEPLVLKHEHDVINHATFSPTGQRILTVSGRIWSQPSACVWDAKTGRLLYVLKGEKQKGLNAAFGPSGHYLVVQRGHGEAALFEAQSGDRLATYSMPGGLDHTWVLPKAKRVLAVNRRGEMRTWPTAPWTVARARRPRSFTPEEREIYELDER